MSLVNLANMSDDQMDESIERHLANSRIVALRRALEQIRDTNLDDEPSDIAAEALEKDDLYEKG